MVALLDINVLIALFDPAHLHHSSAHDWFVANRQAGWATCPLTENGFARIISHNRYQGRRTSLNGAVSRLTEFIKSGNHVFWPDSVTLRDKTVFSVEYIGGHKRVTDCYLLALAIANKGRLVTFDRGIQRTAVLGSNEAALVVLSLAE